MDSIVQTSKDCIALTLDKKWKDTFDKTIDFEEAKKVREFDGWNSSKYCAIFGCTKVIVL